MGTSIDVLFHRDIKTPEETTLGLAAAFRNCPEELAAIAQNAWYSITFKPWDVELRPECDGEPAYLTDESGPYGFDVSVYEKVVVLGSLERFSRLYDSESPVARPLQRVIEAVVRTLARNPVFAAVGGGMGDSDKAIDLACYESASFSEVCDSLLKSHGPPARSWSELSAGENPWCLIELTSTLLPRVAEDAHLKIEP